ncbi:MAG: hypothetical protein QM669_08935 [Siphonobacter sp.]
MVVDNAISHQPQLEAFNALLSNTEGIATSLVAVGKGELLIWKAL